MLKTYTLIGICMIFIGCKDASTVGSDLPLKNISTILYAKGFHIENFGTHAILTIKNPWPESDLEFRYLLKSTTDPVAGEEDFEAVLNLPIQSIVVTSTTHIPSLEMLGTETALIGFPNLDYISSTKTRTLIESGKIRELGKNEDMNTELLIEARPDVVVTFAVEGKNKTVNTLQRAGIPVLYNADWTETHPLGKAEWIKFFGLLFQKEREADSIFSRIEKDYNEAKKLAETSMNQPTVVSGAMFKDVWYLPQGDSWAAQFIADAHGDYLWKDRKGTGSLSLNLESVLETGKDADFWIGPGQYTHYDQMKEAHSVYTEFNAYQERKIFSFTHLKGATGGVIYYELAPNRPDLVLKDIIKILHPKLMADHELYFFAPLE
jgi:iron complex transport system substrate-binding protein